MKINIEFNSLEEMDSFVEKFGKVQETTTNILVQPIVKETAKQVDPPERKVSVAVAEVIKEETKEEPKKVLNFTNGDGKDLTLDSIRLKTQEILKIEDKKYYPKVKDLLTEFGAVNVATLKPNQYQTYYDRLLKIVP